MMDDPQKLVDEALKPSETNDKAKSEEAMTAEIVNGEEKSQEKTPEISEGRGEQDARETVPPELLQQDSPVDSGTKAEKEEVEVKDNPTPVEDVKSADQAVMPPPPLAFASKEDNPTTNKAMEESRKELEQRAKQVVETKTEKPKKKGKVLGLVIGLLLTLAGIGGGYYYYTNVVTPQVAQIASSCSNNDNRSDCNASCVQNGAYNGKGEECKWVNGACKNAGRACGGSGDPDYPDEVGAVNGSCTDSANYAYCGGAINKCVHYTVLANYGGCNGYGEAVYGIGTVVGGSCSSTYSTDKPNHCTCNDGSERWCDVTAYDKNGDGNRSVDECEADGRGVCALTLDDSGTTGNGEEYQYSCNSSGCSTTDARCYVVKYTCNGQSGGSCSEAGTNGSNSESFDNLCNATQQIDVACGTTTVAFKTKVFPPCDDTNDSETASLSCSTLTKDIASPEIGDEVTFTCAGTVGGTNPPTITTSAFRYRVDGGNWEYLTDAAGAAGTTASMTVDQAGDYDVQCRVCGEINNASVCDPDWTDTAVLGATTKR